MELTDFQKYFKKKYNLIYIRVSKLEDYEIIFYAKNEGMTIGELVEKLSERKEEIGYKKYETKKVTKNNFKQYLKRNFPELTIDDFTEVFSLYMTNTARLNYYFKK